MTVMADSRPHVIDMRTQGTIAQTPGTQKAVIAAIYVRASTEDQVNGQFTTLDAQQQYCEEYIKARTAQGWQVYPDGIFSDERSGGSMDRPGLRRLMAAVEAGKVQAVVAKASDRLSRDMLDGLMLRKFFAEHGVKFYGVMDPGDTETPAGEFMQNVIMGMAQWERKTIAKRTKDKLTAMRKLGKWTGSPIILGYDHVEKRLVLNQQEAGQVRITFETYARERSLSRTAIILNDMGYRAKVFTNAAGIRKGGKRFTRTNLHYLLKNPAYLGLVRCESELIKGEHEPILEERLFRRVQELLKQNGVTKKSPSQNKHKHLLKGLVRCAACGKAMTPSHSCGRSKSYRYYRCTSVNNLDKSGCSVREVRAEALEGFVVDRLAVLGRDKDLTERVVERAQATHKAELPPLKARQAQLIGDQRRINEEASGLIQAVSKGEVRQNPFIDERLQQLAAERQQGESDLAGLQAEIGRIEAREVDAELVRQNFALFSEVYEQLEFVEKQELVRLLIREVTYDGRDGRIRLDLRQVPALQTLVGGEWMPLANPATNNLYQCPKRLGRLDSNQGMRGSKPRALPLGYAPITISLSNSGKARALP